MGSNIEITAIPDEGYAFQRWGGDVDSSKNPLSIEVADNVVLLPVFVEARPPIIIGEIYARVAA